MSHPRIFVVCGPSGVGKGTIIARLVHRFPHLFAHSVSHTTRPPRAGERDGVDYHFTTVEEMQRQVAAGKFVEHAIVHGNWYGTSLAALEQVRQSGRIGVLDIDVQGARSVRAANLPALVVFIAPPSVEELERRLRGRGTEDEAAVRKRLQTAAAEMEALRSEPHLFDAVVINQDLEEAVTQVQRLLQEDIEVAQQAS